MNGYQRRSVRIGMARGLLGNQRALLADESDPIRVASVKRAIARTQAEVARMERLQRTEGSMSKNDDRYKKAAGIIESDLVGALRELRDTDAPVREHLGRLTAYERARYEEAREAVLVRARAADATASAALAEYQDEALTEARNLRAAAEADADPTQRLADEMERARLVVSGADGDDLARMAARMLDAGQPRRAAMLLAAATDKGARRAGELTLAVEDALDQADEQRAAARAVEEAVARRSADFRVARLRTLAEFGVGVTSDGGLGTGASGQAASASAKAKLAAWHAAVERGEQYSEPVGVPDPAS